MNYSPIHKQCNYRIYPEHRLMIECYSGKIEAEIGKRLKHAEIKDTDFSADYDLLVDLTAATFDMNSREVYTFFEFIAGLSELKSDQKRVAILTRQSDQVAISTIYKMLHGEHQHRYRIFSTLEYALLWLHIDLSQQEFIAKELLQLSQEFA